MSDDSAAARRAAERLATLIHSQLPDVLASVAHDPHLTEDLALALIARRDLPSETLEALAKNTAVMKSRKAMLAVVAHPRTPRHVSLPMVRHLYTFELMSLALQPTLPADLKVAVEEAIITRLGTITEGERLTLAKRASMRVAAALLAGPQARVIKAALDNPYLTEACVVKALVAQDAPQALVDLVCRDEKWSVRREIRVALLRNEHIPLARAIIFAQSLPVSAVRDVLHHSRLPDNVKGYLLAKLSTP